MLTLYDSPVSGNAYKVRLLLAQLGLPCERVELSVVDRSNRREVLGGKNPALRIPVLRLEDGRHLAESNAILWYLAVGTRFLPDDEFARAQVLQWLFFEQYDHEPNVAVARYLLHFAPEEVRDPQLIAAKQQGGHKAIGALEETLGGADYLVAERYSIADIALYAYTHVAGEAGIDLRNYPRVEAWLARIASQPRHVAIDA